MKRIFLTATLVIFTFVIKGQNLFQPSQTTLDSIDKISFLIGTWNGAGWIQTDTQKLSFKQDEKIYKKANGTILQIEGLGKDTLDSTKLIHQAFDLIFFDAENGSYQMKSFRDNGTMVDGKVLFPDEHTIQWVFSNQDKGKVRYTISVQDRECIETGEMYVEDDNWIKFFEMILKKK